MRQTILLFALMCFSTCLTGQEAIGLEEKTNTHLNVNGTNIWLVPPSGFQPSPDFKGFKNPDDPYSMIMIMELPGPFDQITAGFRSNEPLPQGMKIVSRAEKMRGSDQALLIELDQPASGFEFKKHILIYGTPEKSTMINGVFLKDSVELGQRMLTSLLSLYVDDDQVVDPRSDLDYTIDESDSFFQFATVMGNGMLFSPDGKVPTEAENEVSLITDHSFAIMDIDDQKDFCLNRLQQMSFPDARVNEEKGFNEISIDGISGYELFADVYDESGAIEEYIYQVILFPPDGGYYIFLGMYKDHSEANEAALKSVIETFKRKQ